MNRVGSSEESPFSQTIVAATVPGRPSLPKYLRSTSTSITLMFEKVADNGGAPISSYKLYIDKDTGQYVPLTSYNGQSLEWTIQASDESDLVTGNLYSFKVSAVNIIGEGELSNSQTIALAAQATAPTKPTVDRALSSLTSLHIKWT